MGVFDTHKVHHALYRAILARDAVKGVENDIWRGFRRACCAIVAHIDACDLVTTAFQRLGDSFPAHQGDRPLGGPAAHRDLNMTGPTPCANPMPQISPSSMTPVFPLPRSPPPSPTES